MAAIEIIIGSGPHRRIFRFEEGAPVYGPLTLIIEQLNPFLPARLATEGYDIRILSTETPNGEIIDGIRISKLVDEGRVNIRLLDQDGQQLEVDQELLGRVVIVPLGDTPSATEQDSGDTPSLRVENVQTDRAVDTAAETGIQADATRPVRAQRAATVRIRVWEEALRKAREHARLHPRCEVGGICMGVLRKDPTSGKVVVEITDTFKAEHTVNHNASITFTPDTWSAANRVIDCDYAESEERMVGWYHTHPGFGVFLSSYDLFVHEHFFTEPWHIALVIDPIRRDEGVFAWTQERGRRVVRRCPDTDLIKGSCSRPAPVSEEPLPEKAGEQPASEQVQQPPVTLQEEFPVGETDEQPAKPARVQGAQAVRQGEDLVESADHAGGAKEALPAGEPDASMEIVAGEGEG